MTARETWRMAPETSSIARRGDGCPMRSKTKSLASSKAESLAGSLELGYIAILDQVPRLVEKPSYRAGPRRIVGRAKEDARSRWESARNHSCNRLRALSIRPRCSFCCGDQRRLRLQCTLPRHLTVAITESRRLDQYQKMHVEGIPLKKRYAEGRNGTYGC